MINEIRHCWDRRRARRLLRHALKDARHVCNMRGDVAEPRVLQALRDEIAAASTILNADDPRVMEQSVDRLAGRARQMAPPRTHATLRENVEVLVVAVAVAMAFRTYFIQPFKIPTSSMYPTLHGIQFSSASGPGVTDRWPLKLGKWLIFGEWYVEVKARHSGVVRPHQTRQGLFLMVNDVPHKVDEKMHFHVVPGQTVYRGQLLASAIRTAGDHIFVNRLIWHFRRPQRGEIMVFKTTGIDHPQIKKNEHYVKRMIGLPGEQLRIVPPRLLINGQTVRQPPIMRHIQQGVGDYHGYVDTGGFLEACHGTVHLGPRDYFACGDNQNNSLDSRYWGPVDRMNLVGPTFFVYWPLSRRWGPAR